MRLIVHDHCGGRKRDGGEERGRSDEQAREVSTSCRTLEVVGHRLEKGKTPAKRALDSSIATISLSSKSLRDGGSAKVSAIGRTEGLLATVCF